MKIGRRSGLVLSLASALCLVTALSGAAMASPAGGGVKGDPQPEAQPFKIGPSVSGSSTAMEPNGSLVVAYDIKSGSGKVLVCLLNRGSRACSHKTVLTPLSGDDTFGGPQVFIPSANHVVVLQGACCDRSANGGDVLYSSTDGGRTFGAPVRVGSLGVTAAALIGGDIVFTAGDNHDGGQVESIGLGASGPPASLALPNAKVAYDVGLGNSRGGALFAMDDLESTYTTYVDYASSGSDFNATSSYHSVGKFPGEQLMGVSGNALLTIQTHGKEWVELRLFNGKTFGPAHQVPGTSGGGPEWFAVYQDASGAVHVFSDRGLAVIYHLLERTTTSGAHWSGPANLGDAIDSNTFSAALDRHGTGLVVGTSPAWGYPVLDSQSVSFSLKSSSVRKGKSTTGSGKGSPAAAGRVVWLQVERSGKWFTIATTHEKSGGTFSFTIKGSSDGTFPYRAVTSDLAGYLRFGYSNAKSLKVTG